MSQTGEAIAPTEDPAESLDDGEIPVALRFEELTLSIPQLMIYDDEGQLDQVLSMDSVYLSVPVGSSLEGQNIQLQSDLLTDLTVEQCFETSVTIMNEGPHCDLIDWKHHYSDWKPLEQTADGQFLAATYSEKEGEKFPDVSIEALKAYVKEHCGEEWHTLIRDVRSVTEYPSGVSISQYFLRITGKRKDDGRPVVKIIRIESPMGC